jgi:hypothetical protein
VGAVQGARREHRYENYYNASKSHMLYPSTRFRAGAAAYRDLWGR